MAKSKKAVRKVAKKHILNKKVDNKLSILLIVLSMLIFVLAASAMSR